MRTLIRDVRVFDGERTIPKADVLIDGDRIAEVAAGPVDVEVDGAGKTLLPGLIDAHAHAFDGDLEEALKFGVTTELDMNNLPPILARQRRQAAERDDVADLRSSSMIATAPGGHPTQLWTPDLIEVVGSDQGLDAVGDADQAKAFVEARLAEGVDYLKIAVDDGSASGMSLPVLSPELAAVLVEAAHGDGTRGPHRPRRGRRRPGAPLLRCGRGAGRGDGRQDRLVRRVRDQHDHLHRDRDRRPRPHRAAA
jgi:dihydroorotase-like cyclic amidohydrolase